MLTIDDFKKEMPGDVAPHYFTAAQRAMSRAGVAWDGCSLHTERSLEHNSAKVAIVRGKNPDGVEFEWAHLVDDGG